MERTSSLSEFNCIENGLDLVTYPLYRIIQCIYTTLALAAVPMLVYVQAKYIIFGSICHRNLKMILSMYCSFALLEALTFIVIEGYEIGSSFVTNPCDFFPSQYVYFALHVCNSGANIGLVVSIMMVTFERLVATVRVGKYESNGTNLGYFLCSLTVFIDILVLSMAYKLEQFNVIVPSMLNVPPTALNDANILSVLCIIVSVACIVALNVSSRINRKRTLSVSSTLTSRYQTRENLFTTQYATHLACLQVSFFIAYAIGTLIVRGAFQDLNNTNKPLFYALRQLIYVIPVFVFTLSIFSAYRLKCYQKDREDNIRTILKIETRGVIGTKNYEEVIMKSWKLSDVQHA